MCLAPPEQTLSRHLSKCIGHRFLKRPRWLDALANITALRAGKWIDLQTRRVRVSFTLYSPNAQLFIAIEISFKMPYTGALQAHFQVHARPKTSGQAEGSFSHAREWSLRCGGCMQSVMPV